MIEMFGSWEWRDVNDPRKGSDYFIAAKRDGYTVSMMIEAPPDADSRMWELWREVVEGSFRKYDLGTAR